VSHEGTPGGRAVEAALHTYQLERENEELRTKLNATIADNAEAAELGLAEPNAATLKLWIANATPAEGILDETEDGPW